jgi:hypothetical protein
MRKPLNIQHHELCSRKCVHCHISCRNFICQNPCRWFIRQTVVLITDTYFVSVEVHHSSIPHIMCLLRMLDKEFFAVPHNYLFQGFPQYFMYKSVSKSFWTGRLEWKLQMVQLCTTRCSCIAILWVSVMSFATITFCVASQWVFIIIVYWLSLETFIYTLVHIKWHVWP